MAALLGLDETQYNECIFGDVISMTLRFVDRWAEIVTAASSKNALLPLPFCDFI